MKTGSLILFSILFICSSGYGDTIHRHCVSFYRQTETPQERFLDQAEHRLKSINISKKPEIEEVISRLTVFVSENTQSIAKEKWTNVAPKDIYSLARAVAEGHSVDFALSYWNKTHLAPYFNSLTGKLTMPKVPRFKFSLENGRQKLKAVRINFGEGHGADQVLRDYANISQFLPGVEFVIVTERKEFSRLKFLLEQFPKDFSNRTRVVSSSEQFEIGHWSIWAQDGSKPIEPRDSKEKKKLNTVAFQLENQREMIGLVGSSKTNVVDFPVSLEGGNMVVGDRHILVGPKIIQETIETLQVTEKEAIGFLESSFGKKVLSLGVPNMTNVLEQRSFHLDLDIVIALNQKTGYEVALVRSPIAMMTEIMGLKYEPRIPDIAYVQDLKLQLFEYFKKKVRVRPLSKGTLNLIKLLAEKDPTDMIVDELQALFMAKVLKENGYHTQMVPGYGTLVGDGYQGQTFFMGTNAILSKETALISGNDIYELDQANARIYKNLGYFPLVMRSSATTIECFGGIRCVTETFRIPIHTRNYD